MDAAKIDLTGNGPGSLSAVLEFHHVVKISAAGELSDAPRDVHAPECFDPDPDALDAGEGWELITAGLTGQYGYRGPWLHNSELIMGGVAQHILEHAAEHGGGYYVSVYATYPNPDNPYGDDEGETVDEGWAVAYRPGPDTPHPIALAHGCGFLLGCDECGPAIDASRAATS